VACSARERAQAEVAMTMIARELAVPVRIIVREGYIPGPAESKRR
jgi:hypothetical protein